MRLLFDTNVVLDVMLDREPFAAASGAVWAAIETGGSKGLLAAHAVTTIHYLLRREMGNARATKNVALLLRVFEVASVDGAVLQSALQLNQTDFEDSVTSAAAQSSRCDFIVTRDPKGFRASPIRALTPEAVLPLMNSQLT